MQLGPMALGNCRGNWAGTVSKAWAPKRARSFPPAFDKKDLREDRGKTQPSACEPGIACM